MKSSRCFVLTVLVLIAMNTGTSMSFQREPVGPTLGFTLDAAGSTIWPIIGIPGAAAFGDRVSLERTIHGTVISSPKNYAIGISDDDGTLVAVLLNGQNAITPIPGVSANPDVISISPTGSAAAVYSASTQTIEIIRSLPQSPEILQELDVSGIPGRAVNMTLSDDGAIALVNFSLDEDSVTELWIVDSSGPRSFGTQGSTTPAFFPNRHDAIIADDATQTAYIVRNVDQEASRVGVVSVADGLEALSNVSVSGDGGAAVIADNKTGTLAIVNAETQQATLMNCGCKLTGLYRLARNSFFQLTSFSDEPVSILDVTPGEPRVLIIPPLPPERRTQP